MRPPDQVPTRFVRLLAAAVAVAFALALQSSSASPVIVVHDTVAGTEELLRAAAAGAGIALISSTERDAGVALLESQGVRCVALDAGDVDAPCLAKLALIVDADVVVASRAVVDVPGALDIVAIDSAPRIVRARAASPDPTEIARALADALAQLAPPPSPAPPPAPAPPAPAPPSPAPPPAAPPADAPAAPAVVVERELSVWSLLGAGLAGAGVVALAAGGVTTASAVESMARAESTRFQDDAARFGAEANGKLWLSSGAFAAGVVAVAAGGALVTFGDEW